MSRRLRRTILCLPFFIWIGDHSHAAELLRADDPAASAQRVVLTPEALGSCGALSVSVGAETWQIVCDRTIAAPGLRYWEGHVAENASQGLSFQVRPEGVTGLLDLPGRPLRLGLIDGVQWLLDTPAAQLHEELVNTPPPLFVLRELTQNIPAKAAIPGAVQERIVAAADDVKPADVAYPVTINLADIATVAPGGQVNLALPDQQQEITYEKTVVSPDGASTWLGHLTQYGRDYRVVLTYGLDGSVTGAIQAPNGELLVTGKPGRTWIVDTAASNLRHNPTAKDDDALPPPASASHAVMAGATATAGAIASTTASATTSATNTVVDLLVLYTPGLVTRYGGEAGAANRIDYFIALANQAYADSGVPLTVRKVGAQRVSIADNTSNSNTLGQLQTASGAFSTIPALRNAAGADAVLLVRPFDMTGQGGNCGVGYIGGYAGAPMSGYAESAYAVVSEGSDTKGQGYFCTDYTFAHELGHNMGLMHDRATVASQGGGTGALPYAFGYGRSGVFGTVMSYMYPVVGRFSNPLDLSCGNGPCGVASTDAASSADNAKALGITRTAFSAYRATAVAGKVSIAGVVTIDGKAAANVKVLANGATCATSSAAGLYACSFDAGWSGTIAASASTATFAPPSATYSNLQASASQNFIGVSSPVAVTINGVVKINGILVPGAKIVATGATCTLSDAVGAYSCKLMTHGSGSVSATFLGTTFSPASIAFSNILAPMTANFTGTRPAVAINGVVTVKGLPKPGVAVNAGTSLCGITDAKGAYACTRLKEWSGRIAAPQLGTAVFKDIASLTAPTRVDFVVR